MRRKYNYEVSFPKVNFSKIFIFFIAAVILYYFVSNSIVKYFILRNQYYKLKKRLQEINAENQRLQNEIYLLKTDTATIEYYIRKTLFYKKPNEKVVIFKSMVKKERGQSK